MMKINFKIVSRILSLALIIVFALTSFVNATVIQETVTNDAGVASSIVSFEYDDATDTLTIKKGTGGETVWDYTYWIGTEDGNYSKHNQAIADKYKSELKHLVIESFYSLSVSNRAATFFSNFPELESVHFKGSQGMKRGEYMTLGFFEGCPKLKTIWFGEDSNKKEGVINLSNWTGDNDAYVLGRMFKDCTSITEVILPSDSKFTKLDETTFSGCTSLKKITIPANFAIIAENAFDTCTSLSVINAPVGSEGYKMAINKNMLPTLWDSKPLSGAVKTGYLIDNTKTETNIKYEIYKNFDTDYSIYFFIDDEGYSNKYPDGTYKGNTVAYPGSTGDYIADDNGWIGGGPGWVDSDDSLHYNKQAYYDANISSSHIKTAVFGDGITELGGDKNEGGLLSSLSGLSTVEFPSSLVKILPRTFRGCTNLSSVYTRGVGQIAESGTLNFSNINQMELTAYNFSGIQKAEHIVLPENMNMEVSEFGWACFSGCENLKSITIPKVVTKLEYDCFANCSKLAEITVYGDNTFVNAASVFSNCNSLKKITAPVGSKMHKYAMENRYETTHEIIADGYVNYNGANLPDSIKITYDPETKQLLIVPTQSGVMIKSDTPEIVKALDAYKDYAVTAKVGDFGRLHIVQDSGRTFFKDFTELKEVNFALNQRIMQDTYRNYGVFYNCPKLTTVWFGDETNKIDNCVNLEGMYNQKESYDGNNIVLEDMFAKCSSIENVILPTYEAYTKITADTFYGCTSLKEITIPKNFVTFFDTSRQTNTQSTNAFESCTALKRINYAGNADISKAVAKNTGVVIHTNTAAEASVINGHLTAAGVPVTNAFAFANGMKHNGFEIKHTGNNGMRAYFSFNENVTTGGDAFTLVEYGTLSAKKTDYTSYTEDYNHENSILKLSGTEFVVPTGVTKNTVYSNGTYIGTLNAKDKTNVKFNAAITNMSNEEQFKADMMINGYEVWKKGEQYYVIFTKYDDTVNDVPSLYKLTIDMLLDGVITLKKGDNPIWNMLNSCTKTDIDVTDAGITGILVDHPTKEGKKVAIYVTDSDTSIDLTSLHLTPAVKLMVNDIIIGENINYSLPQIDDYWQAHIDTQLAKVPAGKSFIYSTDIHFDDNSGKYASLIDYTRKMSGIKTVINAGDPYGLDSTKAGAMAQFEEAVVDNFYNIVGSDGLFAVGNHDSNYLGWRDENEKVGGALDGLQYKYLVPDTFLFNNSVAKIGDKAKFDTKLINKINELDSSLLKEVGDVNNGGYTVEQMKEEMLAWAKMHYYYDDPVQGIRYIVLDTGGLGVTSVHYLNELWSTTMYHQLDWIYDTLVDTATNYPDYDVVVTGHMLSSKTEGGGWEPNFELYKMLNAFKAHTSVDIAFSSGGTDIAKALLPNGKHETLKYDFSSGTFDESIFVLTGHDHVDHASVYYKAGDAFVINKTYTDGMTVDENAIFAIITNQDAINNDVSDDDIKNFIMTPGTTTENSFSIITIMDNGDIVMTRIGAGSSRTFSYNK